MSFLMHGLFFIQASPYVPSLGIYIFKGGERRSKFCIHLFIHNISNFSLLQNDSI